MCTMYCVCTIAGSCGGGIYKVQASVDVNVLSVSHTYHIQLCTMHPNLGMFLMLHIQSRYSMMHVHTQLQVMHTMLSSMSQT